MNQSCMAQQLPTSWQVNSTYIDPMSHRDKTPIVWQFTTTVSGAKQLVDVHDVMSQIGLRAELTFNQDDLLVKADCYNKVRNSEVESHYSFDPPKPALINDSLIPLNWPNQSWDGTEHVYKIVDKIGTQTFEKKVRVSMESISIDEALSKTMLTNHLVNSLGITDLMLIRFEKLESNGTARQILLQLWSSQCPVWLYEEALYRKSYLIQLN